MKTTHKTGHPKPSHVRVNTSQSKLRLRFIFNGKRYSLSLRLDDTPDNQAVAQEAAVTVKNDIDSGSFDPNNLDRYKARSTSRGFAGEKAAPTPTLIELWDSYVRFKARQVEKTTIDTTYRRVRNWLVRCPHKQVSDAIAVRDFLLSEGSAATAKKMLVNINACCKYACSTEVIAENPFEGLPSSVRSRKTRDIDPFTSDKLAAILLGFEQSRHFSYYLPPVRFLALTGCRPSEAVALGWTNIYPDYLLIDSAPRRRVG